MASQRSAGVGNLAAQAASNSAMAVQHTRWLGMKTVAWLVMSLLPMVAAAQGDVVRTPEVQAQLVVHAPDGVQPGKPLWAGLLMRHAPHWHTYWKNPGDSGLPTTLSWQLPAGVVAGPIEWPTPRRLPVGPLVNYGYEGTLLLPVPLTVPANFQSSSLPLALRADWLVCKEVCIPQSGEFTLNVPAVASSTVHASAFAQAQAAMPRTWPSASAQASVERGALTIDVQGLPPDLRDQPLQLFAEDAGVINHAAPIEQRWRGERLLLRVPLSAQRSESPAVMRVVLTASGDRRAVVIPIAVAGWPATAAGTVTSPAAAAVSPPALVAPPTAATSWPLLVALALAFLGGLLLNAMPCVFPVLSLKVLGFARDTSDAARHARAGLAYTAGVVLSFIALAAALLVMRATGEQLGWGFQLQSPLFVAALAVLFTLMGLNLLGVFRVGRLLPSRLATLRAHHPLADHALTGVLAVLVASPCTAPFMGAAMGAALTWPAPQALAVFAALGLGMAAPYLAVSLWPGLARRLPRPGPWMHHFKTALAFPMFATVVWLVWVIGQQAGIDGVAALLGVLLALAFLLWALGTVGLGPRARVVLGSTAGGVMLAALVWAWPALPLHADGSARAAATHDGGWEAWSPAAVAAARAQARPVFVDFTAAWCVTCQFNKRTTLANDAVLADFRARGVVLLRADWTRRDAAITRELTRLGRTGVPVYVLYGPGAAEPELLSEVLTVAGIRDAMARWPAAGTRAAAASPQRPID